MAHISRIKMPFKKPATPRICYVCGKKVEANELGFHAITHTRCRPGSLKWMEYFQALPPEQRTEAGQILYNYKIKKIREGKVTGNKAEAIDQRERSEEHGSCEPTGD